MKTIGFALLLLVCISRTACGNVASFGSGADQFTMSFVPIGNPGNAADTTGTPNPAGAVAYYYNMGKYEVSRDMVTKASAAGNLGVLLDQGLGWMGFVTGGPRPAMPATGVSWNQAARFVNWLNTSQGYQPAYKFATQPGDSGYSPYEDISLWISGDPGYDVANPFRNTYAKYFFPDVDEWYKAAFYDSNANGGGGGYGSFATGGDSPPMPVASGTNPGTAVYAQPFQQGPADITQAGGLSPYGIMAMGGNVWELQETEYDLTNDDVTAARGVRGASWRPEEPLSYLSASTFNYGLPWQVDNHIGIRVASVAATFTGIGDLAGGTVGSYGYGVSADGTTVVGQSNSANGDEAFRWTRAGGIAGLGDLTGGTFSSRANGVSGDGSIVVGQGNRYENPNPPGGGEAFRWTSASGINGLGTIDTKSAAYAVSANGDVIVGTSDYAYSILTAAVVWTDEGKAKPIHGGDPIVFADATSVSADGLVIAVNAMVSTNINTNIALRWTTGAGAIELGFLPGGLNVSAHGISSDGSAIVGRGTSSRGDEAFRWSAEEGMVALGDLPGGAFASRANGVSQFGAAVVGFGTTDAGQRAIYWDALGGMQELQPFLAAEFGLSCPGWTLTEATAITPDGHVIVGNGTNPDGNPEGWIVDLSDITDVTWGATADGEWDDGGMWKYGWMPRAVDKVYITPADSLVATGPAAAMTVAALTVNAAASGIAEFRPQNAFTATDGVVVGNAGRITLTGQSLDAGSGLTIDGGGRLQGYGIVYGPIDGTTGVAGLVATTRSLVLTEPLAVGSRQARVLSTGAANLGPEASIAGGLLTAPNGLFVSGSSTLRGHGTVNARISAGIGSQIAADGGDLVIGSATSPAGFFSDGDLATGANAVTINDKNEAVLGSLTMLGDGTSGGTLVAGTAAPGQTRTHFLIEQGKNLIGRGHVVGNVKNHGSAIGDGTGDGERLVFDAGWIVSGIGDFENVLFEGTFAPGLSPGIVDGTDLAVGGTLAIELGGATPGDGVGHHDQVNDAGAFSIIDGATLALQSYGSYLPTPGQEFDIVTSADAILGAFADVTVDPWFVAQGIGFTLEPSASSLTAQAIAVSGDFTSDGIIDGADFLAWQRNAGQAGVGLVGDGDRNGRVDAADLAIWKIQFAAANGAVFASAGVVPEPAAWTLAIVAATLLRYRRRGGSR